MAARPSRSVWLCLTGGGLLLAAAGVMTFRTHAEHDRAAAGMALKTEHQPTTGSRPSRGGKQITLADILEDPDAGRRASRLLDWLDADPAAAGAVLLKMAAKEKGNPAVWHDLMSQLAARWMEKDPDRALAWVESLPEGAGKSKAQIQCAYRWTEIDPAAAADHAFRREDPKLHQTVIGKWAEVDPAAAAAWAKTWSITRPESSALASATAIWAQTDAHAAASFALNLEKSDARRRISASVVSTWAMTDSSAAARWLETLPSSPTRDHVLDIYCQSLDPVDPARSFEWAESISDVSSREEVQERAAMALIQSDPKAAMQKIDRSSLPDSIKNRLLASMSR